MVVRRAHHSERSRGTVQNAKMTLNDTQLRFSLILDSRFRGNDRVLSILHLARLSFCGAKILAGESFCILIFAFYIYLAPCVNNHNIIQ